MVLHLTQETMYTAIDDSTASEIDRTCTTVITVIHSSPTCFQPLHKARHAGPWSSSTLSNPSEQLKSVVVLTG